MVRELRIDQRFNLLEERFGRSGVKRNSWLEYVKRWHVGAGCAETAWRHFTKRRASDREIEAYFHVTGRRHALANLLKYSPPGALAFGVLPAVAVRAAKSAWQRRALDEVIVNAAPVFDGHDPADPNDATTDAWLDSCGLLAMVALALSYPRSDDDVNAFVAEGLERLQAWSGGHPLGAPPRLHGAAAELQVLLGRVSTRHRSFVTADLILADLGSERWRGARSERPAAAIRIELARTELALARSELHGTAGAPEAFERAVQHLTAARDLCEQHPDAAGEVATDLALARIGAAGAVVLLRGPEEALRALGEVDTRSLVERVQPRARQVRPAERRAGDRPAVLRHKLDQAQRGGARALEVHAMHVERPAVDPALAGELGEGQRRALQLGEELAVVRGVIPSPMDSPKPARRETPAGVPGQLISAKSPEKSPNTSQAQRTPLRPPQSRGER